MASQEDRLREKIPGASIKGDDVYCACTPPGKLRKRTNSWDGSKFFACPNFNSETGRGRCNVKFNEPYLEKVKDLLRQEPAQTPRNQRSTRDGLQPTPPNSRTPTVNRQGGNQNWGTSQATPSTEAGRISRRAPNVTGVPTPGSATGGSNKRRMQDVGDELAGPPPKKSARQLFPSNNARDGAAGPSLESSSTDIENRENKPKDSTAHAVAHYRRDIGVQTSEDARTPLAAMKNMNDTSGET